MTSGMLQGPPSGGLFFVLDREFPRVIRVNTPLRGAGDDGIFTTSILTGREATGDDPVMTTLGKEGGTSRAVRRPVLLGLFTGTAAGAGFLLAGVPNLELMSLVVALCGAVLGSRPGMACGVLAASVYSLGSPYGPPMPQILAGQAAGMAWAGLLGGWAGPRAGRLSGGGRRIRGAALGAACGLLGTLGFEILTNLAIITAFDLEPKAVLAGAVPFTLIHVGTNTVIFAVFLPLLAHRLGGLAGPSLIGRVAVAALAVLLVAGDGVAQDPEGEAVAPVEAAPGEDGSQEVESGEAAPAANPFGWKRGLWRPFAPSGVAWLSWYSPYFPVIDGGLGAPVFLLGEAGTSPAPLILRDGIPQGTGHALADDAWLVNLQGQALAGQGFGWDGWGGTGGHLSFVQDDPLPDAALTSYTGTKGPHEGYMRGARLLTPRSPWRLGFEFVENLDIEGYNATGGPDEDFDPVVDEYFPGHARIRQSHARLTRTLAEHAALAVEYDYGRKTKDALPALGADHQEIWDDGLAASMQGRWGRLGLQSSLFWRNRDVAWGDVPEDDSESLRMLETGREGLILDLALFGDSWRAPSRSGHTSAQGDSLVAVPADSVSGDPGEPAAADSLAILALTQPPGEKEGRADPDGPSRTPLARLKVTLENWTVNDTGADTLWAAGLGGPLAADGQAARVGLVTGVGLAGARATVEAAGDWTDRLGWDPACRAALAHEAPRPVWAVFWEQGGRAPRSDETVTVLRRDVAGRELVLEPNGDLVRENTTRLGARFALRLMGTDLAVDAARTSLSDGITWVPAAGDPDRGRWDNALTMDTSRVTASLGREGRFLGWGRIFIEQTWQDFAETQGRAAFLPPEEYLRIRLLWENHFFAEDGILQLGLFTTRVPETNDPWDVTRSTLIPGRTVHDLIVGFRLVGAHISLAFRNLTGDKYRQTAASYASPQELDLRLSWTFTH